MANFYTDNEDIKFHLGHPLMEKIVALKERNFTEAEQYDNAPRDFEDATRATSKTPSTIMTRCWKS